MDGVELDFYTEFKYLGHWFLNDLSDVKDMKRKLRVLHSRVNNLIGCFYDCSVNIKMFIMETFLWGGFIDI